MTGQRAGLVLIASDDLSAGDKPRERGYKNVPMDHFRNVGDPATILLAPSTSVFYFAY